MAQHSFVITTLKFALWCKIFSPLIPPHFSQSPFSPPLRVPSGFFRSVTQMGILASKSSSRQSQSLLVFSIYSKAVPSWPCSTAHRHLDSCMSRGTLGCWKRLCSSPTTATHLIPSSHDVPAGIVPLFLTLHIHPCPQICAGSWPHCSNPLPALGQEFGRMSD